MRAHPARAARSGATTSEPLLSGILILSLSPLVLLPRAGIHNHTILQLSNRNTVLNVTTREPVVASDPQYNHAGLI